MRYIAVFLVVLLVGCRKEVKRCYTCVNHSTIMYNYEELNKPTTKSLPFDQCNMTAADISGFMDRYTDTAVTVMHDTVRTWVVRMDCQPK